MGGDKKIIRILLPGPVIDMSWTENTIIACVLRSVRWPGAGAGVGGGVTWASSGPEVIISLIIIQFIEEIILASPRPSPGSGEDKLCCHLWLSWHPCLGSPGHDDINQNTPKRILDRREWKEWLCTELKFHIYTDDLCMMIRVTGYWLDAYTKVLFSSVVSSYHSDTKQNTTYNTKCQIVSVSKVSYDMSMSGQNLRQFNCLVYLD